MSKLGVSALLCLGFLAWSPEQIPNEFTTMAQQYTQALNAGDAAAVRAFYDDRSTIFTPDGKTVRGSSEIFTYVNDLVAFLNSVGQVTLEVEEVQITGDFAYEVGIFGLALHEGGASFSGHYLTVWRKSGNRWVVHREISTLPTEFREVAAP